jgi:nucleoside-diphosphate-sugar epimerase
MRRALVTGASGFLGGALVAKLRLRGVFVRALVRPGGRPPGSADELCEGDLADPEALRRAVSGGVDWVLHAGARVSTGGSWEDFERVNVLGTRDLIRAAREARVARIVHVSSLGVYAVPSDGAVIREDSGLDSAPEERGNYARSKNEADSLCMAAIEDGAPLTVVRPGILYGPGRRPPLGRRVIALGPLRIVVAGRDYLLPLSYVDNVADAIILAAETGRALGRAYTLVDAHVPQAEYLRLYREISGARWKPIYAPLGLVRLATGLIERTALAVGRRPPVTRHQVERTLRSATFDGRRAREELGWEPRVDVRSALSRSLCPEHAGEERDGAPAAASAA